MMVHQRSNPQRGLSLLELIIALGVLAGSATILAQMVDLGARHAERAATIADAQTVAHNVLHELLIGQRPMMSVSTPEPVDPWSPWDVTIQIQRLAAGDLTAITVRILASERNPSPNGELTTNVASPASSASTPDPTTERSTLDARPTYHLTRWHSVPRTSMTAAEAPFGAANAFQRGAADGQ